MTFATFFNTEHNIMSVNPHIVHLIYGVLVDIATKQSITNNYKCFDCDQGDVLGSIFIYIRSC